MTMECADTEPAVVDERLRLLWETWHQRRDIAARNALFLHYSPWLRLMTARLFAKYRYSLAEWTDYAHFAAIGLLSAIEHFDPSHNVPFEPYAFIRLKGAALNGLENYLSESQKNTNESDAAQYNASWHDEHYDSLDPLTAVVDAAVGLALGAFLELGIVSTGEQEPDPLHIYQAEQETSILASLVDLLPERERLVVAGHYLHQLSFREIADMMTLSYPRVSQLHQQGLKRLRALYEENT